MSFFPVAEDEGLARVPAVNAQGFLGEGLQRVL
jgi:hypothetical protein